MSFKARISVFGGREISTKVYEDTVEIGRLLAGQNWLVYCGGGSGVMEAVSKGVQAGGGICVGILKGVDTLEANPFITIPISTGLGLGRNPLLAYNCDVALAIDGKYGTLSEIAYALQMEKPVVGYGTWDFDAIHNVNKPSEVIYKIKELLQ